MRKGKKVYLEPGFFSSDEHTVRKSTRIADIAMLAAFPIILTYLAVFIPPAGIAAVGFVLMLGLMSFGQVRMMRQHSATKELDKRLERFAEARIGGGNAFGRMEGSLIASVMDCRYHPEYAGQYRPENMDEHGNCLECKKDYAGIASEELNDFIDRRLEKAVRKAEKEERELLFREKRRELNMDSSKHRSLVRAFENPDEIAHLRRSVYSTAALREIDEADLEKRASNRLPAALSEEDEWTQEFEQHGGNSASISGTKGQSRGIGALFSILLKRSA